MWPGPRRQQAPCVQHADQNGPRCWKLSWAGGHLPLEVELRKLTVNELRWGLKAIYVLDHQVGRPAEYLGSF